VRREPDRRHRTLGLPLAIRARQQPLPRYRVRSPLSGLPPLPPAVAHAESSSSRKRAWPVQVVLCSSEATWARGPARDRRLLRRGEIAAAALGQARPRSGFRKAGPVRGAHAVTRCGHCPAAACSEARSQKPPSVFARLLRLENSEVSVAQSQALCSVTPSSPIE
jgi:hypothetical protein